MTALRSLRLGIAFMLCTSALGLTACTATRGWLSHGVHSDRPTSVDTHSVNTYLSATQNLINGSPAQQEALVDAAQTAVRAAPTASHRLELALLLATPGHAASNAEEAARLLQGLVAPPVILSPEQTALATLQLADLKERRALHVASEHDRQTAAATLAKARAEAETQVKALTSENARLKKALDDAQHKLNAITNIERSIRERDNGSAAN